MFNLLPVNYRLKKQYFLALIPLTFITLSGSEAKAQLGGQCGTFTPEIGDFCYQDVYVKARSGYPGSAVGTGESTSFPGWLITGYDQPVEQGSFGEINGPNIQYIQGGSDFSIQSSLESSSSELLDVKTKLESKATVPIEGLPVDVEGMLDLVNKSLRENESSLNVLSQGQTNVDHLQVTVRVAGRCVKHVPFFEVCAENQGGAYEGYVRVHMVYAGNPNEILSNNQAVLNQANQALEQIDAINRASEETKPSLPTEPVAVTPEIPEIPEPSTPPVNPNPPQASQPQPGNPNNGNGGFWNGIGRGLGEGLWNLLNPSMSNTPPTPPSTSTRPSTQPSSPQVTVPPPTVAMIPDPNTQITQTLSQWGWMRVQCVPGAVWIMGLTNETVCVNPTATMPAGQYTYNPTSRQLIPVATQPTVTMPMPMPISQPMSNPGGIF